MSLLAQPRSREWEQRARRLLELAIRRYNRYRGAESRAKLLRLQGDTAIVAFEGSFCETCGINDWVDDLRYTIEDLGGEAELVTVIEPESPQEFYEYRIGVFRIKRLPSPEQLEEAEREEKELEEWLQAAGEEQAETEA
jgi:hypothetical protein